MVLLSGGNYISYGDTEPTFGGRTVYPARYIEFPLTNIAGSDYGASYNHIYQTQLWVYVVVNKRAKATARLPLKCYLRGGDGREEARDHPYARLLRKPNPRHSAFRFWHWTSSTLDVHGEAMWLKIRGTDGRPSELWPVHPTKMTVVADGPDVFYVYERREDMRFPESDIVHFRSYNAVSEQRGMSPLEPLRRTLENEDASRRATSAFWRNGARPGFALSHQGTLSEAAAERLRKQWDEANAGADNTARTVILEEGMEPKTLSITNEEAQYIESRKLNREEVCGAYDVPPPVVHILDRATFSNITEQMRSMYRDTMAPHLTAFEADMATQLAPDFDADGDVYSEFLMDDVLRGAFETRAESYSTAINSGWLTPNEVRKLENLPAMDGADRLYLNATLQPIVEPDEAEDSGLTVPERVEALGALIRAGFSPAESLAAVGLPAITHSGLLPITLRAEEAIEAEADNLTENNARTVMGRLSRSKTLSAVNPAVLVRGLNGQSGAVLTAYAQAVRAGDDIETFRNRVRALAGIGEME